ncbi:MAG TPA: GatB/YqeY domain-containing protein [Gemmatimonadales bacterium]
MPRSAKTVMVPVSPEPTNLGSTLRAALNAARKAQDKPRTLVLGTILANLKNREIELRRPSTDEEVADVLRKGIKIRREAIEQYTAGARQDLADAEAAQIKVLEEFLPPAVDPEEIRAAVRAAIGGGARDIGKVMAQVLPKYKGRADGKLINQIVREELQAG